MPIELKGSMRPGEADRRYYMIRVQVDGRRVVVSSNTRKKDLAQRKEAEVIKALNDDPTITQAEIVALIRGEGSLQHHAALRASGGLTLKQAFDRCLRDVTIWGRLKAAAEYGRNCHRIVEILGADLPLAAIEGTHIKKLVMHMTDEGKAPATINRHLACLRRMFNVALGDGEAAWSDAPKSFPKVKQLKERGSRQYFMSAEDETKLFEAVLALDEFRPGVEGGPPRKRDAHRYYKLFMVLIESGLRLNEALGLLWGEVDMPKGSKVGMIKMFRKEALKSGKPRSVPITEQCRLIFEQCGKVKGGPFADLNDRRAQDIWTRAKKAAGITHRDAVIHSLRHTCACRLLAAGVDLFVVMDWLGHSTIVTTQGYRHLQTGMLTTAASGLTKLRVAAVVEGQNASI
jgi:integrase